MNERRSYYVKNFRKGTPVCPFQHDHPGGEGYEDCVQAFERERAMEHAPEAAAE